MPRDVDGEFLILWLLFLPEPPSSDDSPPPAVGGSPMISGEAVRLESGDSLPRDVPHITHFWDFGQFSYVQALQVHLHCFGSITPTTLFLSLLIAFAASGELGEVRGEVLGEILEADPAPSMLTLILSGELRSGVGDEEETLDGMTFCRVDKHWIHFCDLGQFK